MFAHGKHRHIILFNPIHASIKEKKNSDVGPKEERMELMTITWLRLKDRQQEVWAVFSYIF